MCVDLEAEGRSQVRLRMPGYELTVAGRAGVVLRAGSGGCDVIGPDTTALRVGLHDPAARAGLMQRFAALRLEVAHGRLVASSPGR